jgi:GNAT superfamily N-acetyltransferase
MSPAPRYVRVATASDISEIVRVTNAAYRVEDFFIDGDRTCEAEVAEKMCKPGCAFLVIDARNPNQVNVVNHASAGSGLAASVYVEGRGAKTYFGMLSVAPAHQKTGLARVLIEGVEARARARGCHAVEIDVVNLRTELPAFYARMGFTVTGTAPFLKGHRLKRPVHLVLMEKPL